MRNAVKVGLLCGVFVFISTHSTHALSVDKLALTDDPFHYETSELTSDEAARKKQQTEESKSEEEPVKKPGPPAPQPVQYTVQKGDSLAKIAALHNTSWHRLYAKNLQVADPNIIAIGQVITVPFPEEQLPERPLPAAQPAPATTRQAASTTRRTTVRPAQNRSGVAGNTYAPGYCTWYAKNRRPDLPNRLGNASSWVARAAAQGFATGKSPRAGAIGQQGNHVVYIETVNEDGTVTVSEMNYRGIGVISSRIAPASAFRYIY